MTATGITAGAILVVLVVVVLAVVTAYNGMVRARIQVREAWSGVDIQLKRRASLIPNVVEAVRGYAGHEKGVFEEVARARSSRSAVALGVNTRGTGCRGFPHRAQAALCAQIRTRPG